MTNREKIEKLQKKGYDYILQNASYILMGIRGSGGFTSKAYIFNNDTLAIENGYTGNIRYYRYTK